MGNILSKFAISYLLADCQFTVHGFVIANCIGNLFTNETIPDGHTWAYVSRLQLSSNGGIVTHSYFPLTFQAKVKFYEIKKHLMLL